MKHLVRSFVAAFAFAVLPATAQAAAILEFSTGGGGSGGIVFVGETPGFPGTFNVAGGGLPINRLTVSGAPLNNGVFDVDGTLACLDAVGGCGILGFNADLNSLSLNGSIPELGILAPTLLVTASSFNVTMTAQDIDGVRLRAWGDDSKAAELLAALGLDPSLFRFDLAVTGTPVAGSNTIYIGSDTNLMNTPTNPTPIPEPGSMLLLGTGLIALRARRRK